jgi:hypothetical protein
MGAELAVERVDNDRIVVRAMRFQLGDPDIVGAVPRDGSTICFRRDRFRASWTPSSRNVINSCESCWPKPLDWEAKSPIAVFSSLRRIIPAAPDHTLFTKSADLRASFPFALSGFSHSIQGFVGSRKTSTKGIGRTGHCRIALK